MAERVCPGLPADWFNAWLAAIGAVCLSPSLRLRWSDDPVPVAVLAAPDGEDPAEVLANGWPTARRIAALPIAHQLDGYPDLSLNPDVEAWQARVRLGRTHEDGWALSALLSDMAWDHATRRAVVNRGQMYVGAAAGRTIDTRLQRIVGGGSAESIRASLDGTAKRVQANGLGFDLGRIVSSADKAEMMVDPIVEVLAFMALELFPARGDGRQVYQRRWHKKGKEITFTWVTWGHPMDRDAIDALLDVEASRRDELLSVTSRWRGVSWRPSESKDPTRGYGAERI